MSDGYSEAAGKKGLTGGRLGFIAAALAVFLTDQGSKYIVTANLALYESLPVIPGFFHISYILNSGASFGMFQEQSRLFTVLTGIIILIMGCAVFFRCPLDRRSRILLGFVAGGALGNLTDRIRLEAVVDFLDFQGIWPYIFNVADMGVVCGGIGLALFFSYGEWRSQSKRPKH